MKNPYHDDELYDDGRHCQCGELFDNWGNCPVCDGSFEEWDYDDDDDDEGVDYGNIVYFGLDDEEAGMG